LFVRRADNGIGTIRDVVEQLSPYFLAHKEDILMIEDYTLRSIINTVGADGKEYPSTTPTLGDGDDIPYEQRVFLNAFSGDVFHSMRSVGVELYAEGESGISLEQY
jgi:hypothetical protein